MNKGTTIFVLHRAKLADAIVSGMRSGRAAQFNWHNVFWTTHVVRGSKKDALALVSSDASFNVLVVPIYNNSGNNRALVVMNVDGEGLAQPGASTSMITGLDFRNTQDAASKIVQSLIIGLTAKHS